jgi:hypothetical protein
VKFYHKRFPHFAAIGVLGGLRNGSCDDRLDDDAQHGELGRIRKCRPQFDDPTRKPWDEVWFRGQADAWWRLHTTLEPRSAKIQAVVAYLNVIAEIKSAVETFTGTEFNITTRTTIEETCREYDRIEWVLRASARYMAYLRHGGFPSPLLDWTHSPYVAAYFAFLRAKHGGDVAIYAYRERPVNFKVGGSESAQIISFGPLIKTHRRHFRQQSRYTACVRFEDRQWHFTPHDGVFGMKDHLQQDCFGR